MCVALPAAMPGSRQEEVIDHRLTEREWAEEWKHLNSVSVCDSQSVCTPLDPKAWGGEQHWVWAPLGSASPGRSYLRTENLLPACPFM